LLVDSGIIYKISGYQVGEWPESYSLHIKYSKKRQPYEVTDWPLLKKLIRRDEKKNEKISHTHHHLTRWFLDDNLEIDYHAALEEFHATSWDEVNELEGAEEMNKKFNQSIWAINQLHDKKPTLKTDKTIGRFHTPITGLKKELRRYVTYKGKSLISFDIANAQAFFFSVLLNPELYDPAKEANLSPFLQQFCSDTFIHSVLYLMIPKTLQYSDFEDIRLFRDLAVTGNLYHYLKDHVIPTDRERELTYKRLKQIVFKTFFSDPAKARFDNSNAQARFRANFPMYTISFLQPKAMDMPIFHGY